MSNEFHPNVAKLAARYDYVVRQLQSGVITAQESRQLMLELRAKDDHGVEWRIDPASGKFQRKSVMGGTWVYDTPPSFGVDTADPFQYSDTFRDDNPAFWTNNRTVEPVDVRSPAVGLSGITRKVAPDPQDMRSPADEMQEVKKERKTAILVSLIVGLSLLVVVGYALASLA